MQLQAARQGQEKDDGGGGEVGKGKDGGDEGNNSGYDQALLRWKVNEAVERAGGRARAFLRQLWCVNLLILAGASCASNRFYNEGGLALRTA